MAVPVATDLRRSASRYPRILRPTPRPDSLPELTLRDALAKAASQHPLIEAARARLTSARGGRRTAGAIPNPVLTYMVEDARDLGGKANIPLERETQTYLTLPLEPLFQRWPRVRQSDAEVRAAQAELTRAEQMVALDAARAFFRVASAQVAVDAAEELRARWGELVTFTSARVREGITPEGELIRTRLELDRVTASLTLERVEWARARAALAPYLGGTGPPATPVRIGDSRVEAFRVAVDSDSLARPMSAMPMPALATLMAQARAARPELIAARERVAAARADVGLQRTLTVQQLGATLGTKRRAGLTSLTAGLTLPLPLFNQNRGEVQRATGQRMAAEQELLWTERQVAAEVAAAADAVLLLAAQLDELRGSFLSRAEESQRIALAAYQDGAVSLLQVLDASRALADARIMYYRTLFAQRQSVLELNAAIGTALLGPPPHAGSAGGAPSAASSDSRLRGDAR
ncbi:MAG: TolC family protein [Gemmatimonadaceae bacterium]